MAEGESRQKMKRLAWYLHRWQFNREVRAVMKQTVVHGMLTTEDVRRILGMARTLSRVGITANQMVNALVKLGG